MQKVFFASLTKVKDADDDTLEVHGIASTESRDSAGETILASAIRKALPSYREYPAIREMHGLSAAGRAIEIDVDDDGVTHVVAKIVDPNAIKKVRNKVYGGLSVGGRVLKRDPKDRSIIVEIELSEISLVDRPAHPEARISLWKAAGLHGGAEFLTDDLAKVTRQRDVLAEQLAKRDAALAGFADRTESVLKAVKRIATENQRLQQENAALNKRFAAVQPRMVNPEALNKTLADLETIILPKLEADTALLRARFDHQERGGRLDA